MGGVTVLPDTNLWRYIVDADAVETIRKAAKSSDVAIVACPAVIYECLRSPDPILRRKFAKALTRHEWIRPMPEVFVECGDIRAEITRIRPEWLISSPDLRAYEKNRKDWQGAFWARVRTNPHRMGRIIRRLGSEDIAAARHQAHAVRQQARDGAFETKDVRLGSAMESFNGPVPGWDGEPFDSWRGFGMTHWWEALVSDPHQPYLDWLSPWLDMPRVRRDFAGWVKFWTRGVTAAKLPREWIRWAMFNLQAVRKVSPGTPVDAQISTYLVDYDLFVTEDRRFAQCVEEMRPHAPVPLAKTSVCQRGTDPVDHLLGVMEQFRAVR